MYAGDCFTIYGVGYMPDALRRWGPPKCLNQIMRSAQDADTTGHRRAKRAHVTIIFFLKSGVVPKDYLV